MTRKLLICTWFGDLPEWYDDWQANVDRLTKVGYDVFLAQHQIATMPLEQIMRSLKLFDEEVMPAFN